MDEAASRTSPADTRPIWKRPVSRRAVLATGAAGATATALAVLWKGDGLSQILDHVRDLTHGYQGALNNERVRVAPVFGEDLSRHMRFRAAVTANLVSLVGKGVRATLAAHLARAG